MKVTKHKINKVIAAASKGFFSDDAWEGVSQVWNAIRTLGVDVNITFTKYDNDSNNIPCRKTWGFEVLVNNKTYYGRLVAAGAGSVTDPLDKYDIIAYVS